VGKHVSLPKTALEDVASLVRLDRQQTVSLAECFTWPESIGPIGQSFIHVVSERIRVDLEQAESIILVCQFLLTVVEGGSPVGEVLDDLREFIAKNDFSTDKEALSAFDLRRNDLVSLLAPKPSRVRAQKVRYLGEVFPTVESFRTVCELRPVFEGPAGHEEIIGYVSVVLLKVKLSDSDGEESTVHLQLSPGKMRDLEKIIKRTNEKLATIQSKFGDELLGSRVEE